MFLTTEQQKAHSDYQKQFLQQSAGSGTNRMHQQHQLSAPSDLLSVIKPIIYYPDCKVDHLLHQGEKVNFICLESQCETRNIGCAVCMDEAHKGHSVKPMKVVMQLASARAYKIAENNNEALQKMVKQSEIDMMNQLNEIARQVVKNIEVEILAFHKKVNDQIQTHSRSYITGLLDKIYLRNYSQQFSNKETEESVIIEGAGSARVTPKNITKYDNKEFQEYVTQMLQGMSITKEDFFSAQQNQQLKATQMFGIGGGETGTSARQELTANQKKAILERTEACTNFQELSNEVQSHFAKVNQGNMITKLLCSQLNYFKEMVMDFNVWGNREDRVYQFTHTHACKNGVDIIGSNVVVSLVQEEKMDRYCILEPSLPFNRNREFAFKINKLNPGHLISIGLSHLKQPIQNDYKRFRHSNIGHGAYMISNNGYSWSDIDIVQNCEQHSFVFKQGDFIIVKYKPVKKVVSFKKKLVLQHGHSIDQFSEKKKHTLQLEIVEQYPLHIAVILHNENDEVEFCNKVS